MKHTNYSGVIYVMGVSGCGKSTIAKKIAAVLHIPFCEADDWHPPENIERMSAGIPLTDENREPWLQKVCKEARELAKKQGACVVACSALKQKYRQTLAGAHDAVYFVYLHGDYDTILSRMSARTGHFMPDSLLKSQFDALEEPSPGPFVVKVDLDQSTKDMVEQATQELQSRMIS